jgi:hypothetical protein
MNALTEENIKEIKRLTEANLSENKEICWLILQQNDLIKINNQLLEDLLFEIKNIATNLNDN